MAKIEKIFDFLLKEKFITISQDRQLPSKEELKGKVYYKYHNSWNHGTNSCWCFKIIIQDMINKGTLKFPEKKKAMVIDEDPFPLVASVNIVAIALRVVLNAKKDERFSPNAKIRKVWILSIAIEKENIGRYPYH